MSEQLKACPFCGGTDIAPSDSYCSSAICRTCDATGPSGGDWNVRTPAPSDAARTQAIEHAARRVLSVFEVARSPHGSPSRAIEPSGATEALDALMVAVESPSPTPPPMETAAVEELASSVEVVLNDFFGGNRDEERDTRPLGVQIRDAIRAALTRLRATTTARDAAKDGG